MFRFWLSFVFVLVAFPCMAADFSLTSPVLKDNGKIDNEQVYSGFGCTGGNISPELQWQNAPRDTKSFAVTVYDPDAPTGSAGGTGSFSIYLLQSTNSPPTPETGQTDWPLKAVFKASLILDRQVTAAPARRSAISRIVISLPCTR